MSFQSTQFVSSRRMSVYNINHPMGIWGDSSRPETSQNTDASAIAKVSNRVEGALHESLHESVGPSKTYDQEASKPRDKVLRRLAQNREAARKSRIKKKAYVQQLESSRLKLAQLEQELQRVRQQGAFVGGIPSDSSFGLPGTVNPDIAAFEMEYVHWVEEQNRQNGHLRSALQQHVSDLELGMLVESSLNHYDELFRMKAIAAKSDVFYLMSGMWKSTTERFFLWIGGFRPSELLKILCPQIDPLTEHQLVAVCNLQQSCQQAEDALSQGMDRLQLTLSETLASEHLDSTGIPNTMAQMATAMGKLDAFVCFVNQADHLRQQTLLQMYRILTIRQAARGLLSLGDYFHRLRALSSIWSTRPQEHS